MKKIIIIPTILFLFSIVVFADSDHGNFTEAKELLEKKITLEDLSDDQLEIIGDYFMELMVGENHEGMDEMMGGEGSENLRQVHISIGRTNYEEYQQTGRITGGMMGSSMRGGGSMMYPWYGSHMWGFGFFGFFFMIAFWAFVIWLVLWLITKSRETQTTNKTPKDILKERYAKGEITKKEYEEMRKELDK